MSFRQGLVGLIGVGMLVLGSSGSFGEDNLRTNADKLSHEVERRGGAVYFNLGEVHYSAFNNSSNMILHSIVLNEGFGFEKMVRYDFDEGRILEGEVIIYDKKDGKSSITSGKEGAIMGFLEKMLELLNVNDKR